MPLSTAFTISFKPEGCCWRLVEDFRGPQERLQRPRGQRGVFSRPRVGGEVRPPESDQNT